MKRLLSCTAVFLALAVTPSRAQTVTAGQKSPVDVVRDFMKIETTGRRLTIDGRRTASVFFIRPTSPYGNRVINVIWDYEPTDVEETAHTEYWAEVTADTTEVGQLDSTLRFKRITMPRRVVKTIDFLNFELVLTDKRWTRDQFGLMSGSVTQPLQWEILDGPEQDIYITIDTALRYVAEMRTKTSDPVIRKNADSTLAELKRMQRPIVKDRPSACACF
ncbi:MAG: hypothetical protein WBE86_14225 [Candidatus Acidiferrales bacterium]